MRCARLAPTLPNCSGQQAEGCACPRSSRKAKQKQQKVHETAEGITVGQWSKRKNAGHEGRGRDV